MKDITTFFRKTPIDSKMHWNKKKKIVNEYTGYVAMIQDHKLPKDRFYFVRILGFSKGNKGKYIVDQISEPGSPWVLNYRDLQELIVENR